MTGKTYRELVNKMFPDTNATKVAFESGVESCQSVIDDLRERKDKAYEERNRLVAALARMFPSGVAKTDIPGWSEDWHGCVYIELPTGQVSWHFHDSHAHLFADLPLYDGEWDGHTTEEKYRRLEEMITPTGPDDTSEDECGCTTCSPLDHLLGPISGMVGEFPIRSSIEEIDFTPHFPGKGVTTKQWWRHHSGRVYEIIGFANQYTENPGKHPIHVLYRDPNGKLWTRPLFEFVQKFTLVEEEE